MLLEHTSPELQYLETKWASIMSYGLSAQLLQDVLPISATQNAATVHNHLHKVAQRQDDELIGKPDCIKGCPREWEDLPKPDKPITIGIDGGYLRNWNAKNNNYGKRWKIEPFFRDLKDGRYGLGLEQTHIKSCERRDRLMLILALSYLLLIVLGQAGEQIGFDKKF